jgi:dynein light intermediate chain 2
MMEVLVTWLEAIRTRVEQCLKALAKSNPVKREAMSKAAAGLYPAAHPDRALVRPLGIPVLIVGTKYDQFQDLEAEQRKVISRTLRFFAHMHGASLLYLVAKDDGKRLTRFRAHLNHMLFGSTMPDTAGSAVTAYTKPLVVPCGADTFEAIGRPGGDAGSSSGAVAPVLAWKEMFDRVFPPKDPEETERASVDDADKYRETMVDAVVAEKEQEFARAARLLAEVSSMINGH